MTYTYQNPPQTDKEGFLNMLKQAYNAFETHGPGEAQLQLADIIDTFMPERVLFAYNGGETFKPRKKKAKVPNPRGTMSDEAWSRIVD